MVQDPKNCLFISDLDGTLLQSGGAFPPDFAQRLNTLIDRGLNFSIATARNYDSAYPILKDVNFKIPVILFNGVYLTDFHSGKNLVLSNFISGEIVQFLMSVAGPAKIDPFVYTYGEKNLVYYRSAENQGSINYLKSLSGDGRLRRVDEYNFLDGEDISGLLLIDSRAALEPIYKSLSDKYDHHLNLYFAEDISMPGFYWLQIFHQQADKGSMVKKLAERAGFPLSQVVVFGDYLNDLEMFRIAGHAIAMGNALPEVKEAAHLVIGDNESGAVIDYLESIWSEKQS